MAFWFKLSLALGMSVAEAQQKISSREFSQWVAYYERDPFGREREDVMLANLTSVVANVSGRLKNPTKPADFLPKYGKPKKQTSAEIGARLRMFAQVQKEIAEKKAARENKLKKAKK